jgi:hypothetical protein
MECKYLPYGFMTLVITVEGLLLPLHEHMNVAAGNTKSHVIQKQTFGFSSFRVYVPRLLIMCSA